MSAVRVFPVGGRGYDRGQVEALMARIEGTLGRAPLTGPAISAQEVRDTLFPVVFRGYAVKAVDDTLLDRIRELEATERGPDYSARPGELADVRLEVGPFGSQWLVDWIKQMQFAVTRLRRGYSMVDVDGFLDRVIAGVLGEAAPVSARDVRQVRFTSIRLAPGYEETEVDRFLEQLASAMDGLQPR